MSLYTRKYPNHNINSQQPYPAGSEFPYYGTPANPQLQYIPPQMGYRGHSNNGPMPFDPYGLVLAEHTDLPGSFRALILNKNIVPAQGDNVHVLVIQKIYVNNGLSTNISSVNVNIDGNIRSFTLTGDTLVVVSDSVTIIHKNDGWLNPEVEVIKLRTPEPNVNYGEPNTTMDLFTEADKTDALMNTILTDVRQDRQYGQPNVISNVLNISRLELNEDQVFKLKTIFNVPFTEVIGVLLETQSYYLQYTYLVNREDGLTNCKKILTTSVTMPNATRRLCKGEYKNPFRIELDFDDKRKAVEVIYSNTDSTSLSLVCKDMYLSPDSYVVETDPLNLTTMLWDRRKASRILDSATTFLQNKTDMELWAKGTCLEKVVAVTAILFKYKVPVVCFILHDGNGMIHLLSSEEIPNVYGIDGGSKLIFRDDDCIGLPSVTVNSGLYEDCKVTVDVLNN